MVRSYVQWGVSALSDEALLECSPPAQGAFPWLLLQSSLTDGQISEKSAMLVLRSRGWTDAEIVVRELVERGLLRDGKIAGWDKYQPNFVGYNAARPTTREGRRLGITREEDERRLATVDEPVDRSTLHPHHGGKSHGDTWIEPRSTVPLDVDVATRAVPSPLLSSPRDGDERQDGEREGGPGGPETDIGKPADWDLQDLLYELTRTRPWGKDWGRQVLDLGSEYGYSDAEAAIRMAQKADRQAKPWELVKRAGDLLARNREKMKDIERREASKNRAERAKPRPSDPVAVAEYQATTYKEPPSGAG